MIQYQYGSQYGFTLIEVMLTMSIVAIIAGFSSLFYGRFVFSQEVSVVQDELQGSFAKAQMYSMTGKDDALWGVTFRVSDNSIVLFRGDTFATRDETRDEIYNVGSKITVSGLDEILFARITGRPDNTPTITISGNGTTDVLSVNAEGVLSLE